MTSEEPLPPTPGRTVLNTVLLLVVPVPAALVAWYLHHPACKDEPWCEAMASNQLIAVNALFFFFVDVAFWIIACAQSSTWLIDPYWTLIPPLLAHFYQTHPLAETNTHRSFLALFVLWVWALRLTLSYFRREKWRMGWREDWRFAEYRKQQGWLFYFTSFFIAYVSQHGMLVGLTLPFLAVHSSTAPLSLWDVVGAVLCLSGVVIATIADNQLAAFMDENVRRAVAGEKKMLVLDSGLWRKSRHPNHCGEQCWWVGVACFAVAAGKPLYALGLLFNHVCDNAVTLHLIEKRMLESKSRAAAYRDYQARVPICWPIPGVGIVAAATGDNEKKRS